MYSALLLFAAILALIPVTAGFRAWRRDGATVLLFPLLALAGGVLAAGLAGAGRWLGPGVQLRDLHALPALTGLFAVPMTLFTFATLARRTGFPWARRDWGHGAVCILAVLLVLAGFVGLPGLNAHEPACWRDVVWYLQAVPPALSCGAGASAVPGGADLAGFVTAGTRVLVMLAWLGLGMGLWVRHRWPWLLAGMVPGTLMSFMPWSAGPLPALIGPLVALATMLTATVTLLVRFPPEEPSRQ